MGALGEPERGADADEEAPEVVLSTLIGGLQTTQLIHVAAKLGIPDRLADGPQTSDQLARSAGVQPRALHRVLRALASKGVFAEREDGRFELTPLAALLQTGRGWRPWALMAGTPWFWRSWGHLLHTVRTGEPAFDHLFGESLFDYLASHPEEERVFHQVMALISREEAAGVLEVYDFSGFRRLVDVGGGHGVFLAGILRAHPDLEAVLFDLPEVVEGARKAASLEDLAHRIEFAAGDFFEGVPEGGDAYLLKHIIHDWDDDGARAILRNCREAMPSGATLLLVEYVIPPGNDPHPGKTTDITLMLVTARGRVRTPDEFRALLGETGFQLARLVPTGNAVSVIEAVPE